jgi:hypothetical protein
MEIKIIEKDQEQMIKNIKWNVVSLYRCGNTFVLSTGTHSEGTFEGFRLSEFSCATRFSKTWVKSSFHPITEPVTIEFIP